MSILKHEIKRLTLRTGDGHISDQGVELACGILITLACQSDANTVWDVAMHPHGLIQAAVNADIRGAHLVFGNFADLLQSTGSPLLEATETSTERFTLW